MSKNKLSLPARSMTTVKRSARTANLNLPPRQAAEATQEVL
jgi:hypothetical protein